MRLTQSHELLATEIISANAACGPCPRSYTRLGRQAFAVMGFDILLINNDDLCNLRQPVGRRDRAR